MHQTLKIYEVNLDRIEERSSSTTTTGGDLNTSLSIMDKTDSRSVSNWRT